MVAADPEQAVYIPWCVVVTIDQLGGSLMHHEPASELADQPGRHADMVEMEMRDDQRVHRRFLQTELPEPITYRFPSRLPIRPAVEEEDPAIRFDGIGVHPGRALEGQRGRDEVDAVAQ